MTHCGLTIYFCINDKLLWRSSQNENEMLIIMKKISGTKRHRVYNCRLFHLFSAVSNRWWRSMQTRTALWLFVWCPVTVARDRVYDGSLHKCLNKYSIAWWTDLLIIAVNTYHCYRARIVIDGESQPIIVNKLYQGGGYIISNTPLDDCKSHTYNFIRKIHLSGNGNQHKSENNLFAHTLTVAW